MSTATALGERKMKRYGTRSVEVQAAIDPDGVCFSAIQSHVWKVNGNVKTDK